MTTEEIKEYQRLADKRDIGSLTNKEYKRWVELVDKSFKEEFSNIAKKWMGEPEKIKE